MNGFNVIYQQFIAMYASGCQICCRWSRHKPILGNPSAIRLAMRMALGLPRMTQTGI